MSSLFHPKLLLGVMHFSLYSKQLLDIVILLHLKPLLDVESFSSKAIIGCYAFLTLFKAIIGYCDPPPSKAIIRCRVFFIQSHYWVLCLSHFIQSHYGIL